MSEFAVEINGLVKKYGDFVALNNASVEIPKNKVVGLIGPNGAGKSSLLRIISGLTPGSSGSINIFGTDVVGKKHPCDIGFMQESNPLPDNMRVGQYLRFRAELKGVARNERRAHVEKIMRLCDIYYEARNKLIKTLSKGFKQRVGIADVLIGNPQLIILDEPTIGLDPHQIIGIRNLVDKIKQNSTMIISSHILSELEETCDFFVIINRGIIIASGDLFSLRKKFVESKTIIVNIAAEQDKINDFCASISLQNYHIVSNVQSKISSIKLTVPITSSYNSILEQFADKFKSKFLGFVEEQLSLEDIFITATKRCRE